MRTPWIAGMTGGGDRAGLAWEVPRSRTFAVVVATAAGAGVLPADVSVGLALGTMDCSFILVRLLTYRPLLSEWPTVRQRGIDIGDEISVSPWRGDSTAPVLPRGVMRRVQLPPGSTAGAGRFVVRAIQSGDLIVAPVAPRAAPRLTPHFA